MNKIRLTRRAVVSSVAAVGAVVAFMLPAAAAVSVQSQSPGSAIVEIKPNAILKFNGAVVNLKVQIACDPSVQYRSLSASLTEALPGGDIAFGSASLENVACNETTQTFTVPVVANVNGKAFKVGQGYASVSYNACSYYAPCVNTSDQRPVNIIVK